MTGTSQLEAIPSASQTSAENQSPILQRMGFFAGAAMRVMVAISQAMPIPALALEGTPVATKWSMDENAVRASLEGVDPTIVEAVVELMKNAPIRWDRVYPIPPINTKNNPTTDPVGFRAITGMGKLEKGDRYRNAIKQLWGAMDGKQNPWINKLDEWEASGPKWPGMIDDWLKRFNDMLEVMSQESQTSDNLKMLVMKTNFMTQYKYASPEWKKKFAVDAANAAAWVAGQYPHNQTPITRIQFRSANTPDLQTLSISPRQTLESVKYPEGTQAMIDALTRWGANFSRSIPAVIPATGKPGAGNVPQASAVPPPSISTGASTIAPANGANTTTLAPAEPTNQSPWAVSTISQKTPSSVPVIAPVNPKEIADIDDQIARNTGAQEEAVMAASAAQEEADAHAGEAEKQAKLAAAAKKEAEWEQERIEQLQRELSERQKTLEKAREQEQAAREAAKSEQQAAKEAAKEAEQQKARADKIAKQIATDKAYKAAFLSYEASWLAPFNAVSTSLRSKLEKNPIDINGANGDILKLRSLKSSHDDMVRSGNPVAKKRASEVMSAYEWLRIELGQKRSNNAHNAQLWFL